jgi:hypothetical protein
MTDECAAARQPLSQQGPAVGSYLSHPTLHVTVQHGPIHISLHRARPDFRVAGGESRG